MQSGPPSRRPVSGLRFGVRAFRSVGARSLRVRGHGSASRRAAGGRDGKRQFRRGTGGWSEPARASEDMDLKAGSIAAASRDRSRHSISGPRFILYVRWIRDDKADSPEIARFYSEFQPNRPRERAPRPQSARRARERKGAPPVGDAGRGGRARRARERKGAAEWENAKTSHERKRPRGQRPARPARTGAAGGFRGGGAEAAGRPDERTVQRHRELVAEGREAEAWRLWEAWTEGGEEC